MSNSADDRGSVLADGLKAKDQDAWRALVKRYEKPLLKIVRRRLPSRIRTREDAKDVVQEVWCGVVENVLRGDFTV